MWEWGPSSECSKYLRPPRPPTGLVATNRADPGMEQRGRVRNCVKMRPCSPRRLLGRKRQSRRQWEWLGRQPKDSECPSEDTRAAGKQDSPIPVTHSLSTCGRTTKHAGLLLPTPEPAASTREGGAPQVSCRGGGGGAQL